MGKVNRGFTMKKAKCVAAQAAGGSNLLVIFAWASFFSISVSVSLIAAAIYIH